MAKQRRTTLPVNTTVVIENKAVGYIRVSTEIQAEKGLSLAAQKERIIGYCKENNIRLINVFADPAVSGFAVDPEKREGYKSALEKAQIEECNLFIITKRDRLSRVAFSQLKTIYHDLPALNIQVVCIDEPIVYDSPESKMLTGILAQFAEYEVEKIRERTKTAIQHLKHTGCAYTSRKFGYKKIGDKKNKGDDKSYFEIDEQEQKIIKNIIELYDQGFSWRKVATIIEKNFGRNIKPASARRIYLREKSSIMN